MIRKKLLEKILDLLLDFARLYSNQETKRVIFQVRRDLQNIEND